jgi:hypothetical protein
MQVTRLLVVMGGVPVIMWDEAGIGPAPLPGWTKKASMERYMVPWGGRVHAEDTIADGAASAAGRDAKKNLRAAKGGEASTLVIGETIGRDGDKTVVRMGCHHHQVRITRTGPALIPAKSRY